MRIIIVIYFQIAYFPNVFSYDQLIKHGSTVATSSSIGWGGFPNKTVDGNYSQDNYALCMHTAFGPKEAWLRIDLGDVYNLKSVKIWYRNDRQNGNTERLKGFSVRLSNLREPVPTKICYQDPGNETLPVILEKNCTGVARYIWFYTRRDNGAFLEICEVEAYGCPRKKYGEKCVSCDTCKQDCDITGRCDRFGCLHDSYTSPYCKACSTGRYGKNCMEKCGHCERNESCEHINGSCPGFCNSGYHGEKCITKCSPGSYGKNCEENCGQCERNRSCHHVNGSCPGLCEPGYHGEKCLTVCSAGRYGKKCQEICGHCERNEPCHNINGSCPALCEPGYHGEKCLTACNSKWYGRGCQEQCGHCSGNKTCHHVNGACPALCQPGHQQEKCDEPCKPGWYGRRCQEQCGHCSGNKTCHHVNGICPTLCQPGYQQEKCDEPCTNGWYGRECKEPCGYCRGNKPCHNVNGSCFGLCEPGYSGEKCVFSQHLANQREMIKLMRELLVYKRRNVELKENLTSPTDFK